MSLPVLSRVRTTPDRPSFAASTPVLPAPLRQLRVAVTVLFAMAGFVFGSWAARVPDVSAQVGGSHSALGIAVLFMSVGALASLQLTGALSARLGAGRVSVVAGALVGVGAVLPGLATSVPQLFVGMLFFGVAAGALNVAVNSLGVQVQARWGRPLMPSLHAGLSFGGLAGAVIGGLLSGVVGVGPHLVGVALFALALLARVARTVAHADDVAPPSAPALRTSGPRDRRGGAPTAVLVVLGAIAGATGFGEGALADWGALFLREDLGVTPVLAAAGYAGFSLAVASGRLLGGTLVVRLGEQTLLVGGAALAAAGVLLAAWSGSVPLALVGFVLVGLGLANVYPLAIARAGALGGAGGVALATAVGYSGPLGGPLLLGFLAEWTGLSIALSTVAVSAAAVAFLVRSLGGNPVAVRRPAMLAPRCESVPAPLMWMSPRCRRAAAALA